MSRDFQRHFFNRFKNSVKLITFDDSYKLFNANAELPINSFFDDVKNIVKLVNAGKKKVSGLMQKMSSLNHQSICLNSFEKAVIVNVGFGNCCFLFDREKVLAIDCSNKESRRLARNYSGTYSQNIADAIDSIKHYQQKTYFHIDVFLLTHPHFDHFSGIPELASKQYMINTSFFMNSRCVLTGSSFVVLIASLKVSNVTIIDAVVANGVRGFTILHPQSSQPTYSNLNDLSVVSKVDVSNGSFIFPGDLEQNGWSQFCTQSPIAVNVVKNAEYYMLSHHGSKTGFCKQIVPQKRCAISFCSTRRTLIYSGVPHKRTLRRFRHLYKTNRNLNIRYIEVDFSNRTINYR